MKSIIPVVMAGIIAIYGVVVAVLIAGQLAPAGAGSEYTLYKGFVHLGAGLSVGLSGLAQNTHYTRALCTWGQGFLWVSLGWRQAMPLESWVALAQNTHYTRALCTWGQ